MGCQVPMELAGICELPDMGAQVQFPEDQQVLLTAEPYLVRVVCGVPHRYTQFDDHSSPMQQTEHWCNHHRALPLPLTNTAAACKT